MPSARASAGEPSSASALPFRCATAWTGFSTTHRWRPFLVLTPANTHLDIAHRCAEAGKHVLLEKPIEITTTRARELVTTCGAAGVTLGIVLQHRFRPAGMTLARHLASGSMGEVVGCSTVIRLWRPQTYYDEPGRGSFARDGGGVLISQGIPTLDLMLSLAGPIVEVTGYAATSPVHRMETEDMVCAAVRFRNGALGTIDATTAAYPASPERIELITRGGHRRPSPAPRSRSPGKTDVARASPRTAAPAVPAPIPWPSRMTTIAR